MAGIRTDDQARINQYMKGVGRHPVLSRAEEEDAFRRYQQTGDQKAGNLIIESNLRFVISVAGSYVGRGDSLGRASGWR